MQTNRFDLHSRELGPREILHAAEPTHVPFLARFSLAPAVWPHVASLPRQCPMSALPSLPRGATFIPIVPVVPVVPVLALLVLALLALVLFLALALLA